MAKRASLAYFWPVENGSGRATRYEKKGQKLQLVPSRVACHFRTWSCDQTYISDNKST